MTFLPVVPALGMVASRVGGSSSRGIVEIVVLLMRPAVDLGDALPRRRPLPIGQHAFDELEGVAIKAVSIDLSAGALRRADLHQPQTHHAQYGRELRNRLLREVAANFNPKLVLKSGLVVL